MRLEQKSDSDTAASAPSTVRFGAFELDVKAAELFKNGHKIRLQQQPFQILLELLGRPGEVVLREEIRAKLWRNNTVVEFDHSINAAIKRLRDALQDSADAPRYIETLPRLGYRFIAPVSRLQQNDSPPLQPAPMLAVPVPESKLRYLWWLGCTVGIVIIAAALAWVLPIRNRDKADVPLTAVPLTGNLGYEAFPAFSPEGTRVAYSWQAPSHHNLNIYVKLIGQGDPIPLTTGSAQDFSPAWSPDGRWIAFLRVREPSRAAIMVIPSLGGQEREVGPITFDTKSITHHFRSHKISSPFLAWSTDTRWLLSLEQESSHETSSVVRVSVETGEKHNLTFPSTSTPGDGGVVLSPDGRTLAFTRTLGLYERDIYSVPLSDDMLPMGEPARLTFDGKEINSLAWTSDSRNLVFSSKRGGRSELWRMPASPSAQPIRLIGAGDDPRDIAAAREGFRLVYSHHLDRAHIWRMALRSDKAEESRPLISSSRLDGHAKYSPDGRHIAFGSSRSGYDEIWTAQADGSHPVQLTSFRAWAGSPRWSADGQRIAFDSNASGNWDIYVMRAEGGRPLRLTMGKTNEFRPSWSRDGKWIYYCSSRTGVAEVWKIPSAGGAELQVTKKGGGVAFESVDGKDLYYSAGPSRPGELWQRPVEGGNEKRLSASLFYDTFTPAAKGVYFLEGAVSDSMVRLQFFEFATRGIKTITTIPAPNGDEIGVSFDERFMVFDRAEGENSELILIENFR